MVIEQATRLRIGSLQHLKAPIQQVAVLAVRFDTAADPAGGFQHLKRNSPGVQAVGTGQAGDTAADDDDWVFCMCHGRFRLGMGCLRSDQYNGKHAWTQMTGITDARRMLNLAN